MNQPSISLPQIGLDLRVRVPPETTGGTLTTVETTNAPYFGPPLHRHPETEIFYVLEGRYLFQVEDRRFYAATGDVVVAPGGSAHSFVNVSDRPARQLVQIIPGMDAAAFFTELAEVLQASQTDPTALREFGKRWSVEFLGPPLTPE